MKSLRSTAFLLANAIGAAALAWWLPQSPAARDAYASTVYPFVQSSLTELSNRSTIAFFDVTVGVGIATLLIIWLVGYRQARQRKSVWPILRGVVTTAFVLSTFYLWFLTAWGLNYARRPLEQTIPFDATRITPAAVRALADRAVMETNRTYEAAHREGFPAIDAVSPTLAEAVRQVTRELGRRPPAVMAHPKRTVFAPYFRVSGVSGMLAPFFVETLLNPDLTGPERPCVLAHEWAHLAGFAPEADAGFVGVLAALRADAPAQYSAWLSLVSETAVQLDPVSRTLVLKNLAEGPRADQRAINARLQALVPQVERVAWATYDRALKSQGVIEGVKSYSRVVQLILGSDALKAVS